MKRCCNWPWKYHVLEWEIRFLSECMRVSVSVLCGEKLETYLRTVIFLSLQEISKRHVLFWFFFSLICFKIICGSGSCSMQIFLFCLGSLGTILTHVAEQWCTGHIRNPLCGSGSPCQLQMGSRTGCPGVHLQACSRKGLFSTGPLQRAFQFPRWRLLFLSAAGRVVPVRISFSTSVRATLCCSSHLNDSFLLIPLVLTIVSLGVCSSRFMMRGRWDPSLSSLPYLYTHQQFSSSLFPRFSVFSVILLLQASTLIWILLLHALVFHVPLFSVSFTLSLIPLLLDSRLYNLLLNQLNCMASVAGVRLPVSVGLGSSYPWFSMLSCPLRQC